MEWKAEAKRRGLLVVAREIAARRQELHERAGNNGTNLSDGWAGENVVGVAGELAFAMLTDLPFDDRLLAHGDEGYDFNVPGLGTIDVKTYKKPYNLIAKASRAHKYADHLVLAGFRATGIKFLGWEYGRIFKRTPVRIFDPAGPPAHYKPVAELHAMTELYHMITKARLGNGQGQSESGNHGTRS